MGHTEAVSFSAGAEGKPMPRHTPTLLNAAYSRFINWDGRFASTVQLVPAVLANPRNMNLQDETVLVARLESVAEYRAQFREVFDGPPTGQRVAQALDAYVRTLTTPNSAFDRYAAGDRSALTDAQKRGLMLFAGKAECTLCHRGPNFADDQFHALGIRGDDPGRFRITGVEADRYAFKTPTLRNVELTAPYMHDGSIATLPEVIDFYDAGGGSAGAEVRAAAQTGPDREGEIRPRRVPRIADGESGEEGAAPGGEVTFEKHCHIPMERRPNWKAEAIGLRTPHDAVLKPVRDCTQRGRNRTSRTSRTDWSYSSAFRQRRKPSPS